MARSARSIASSVDSAKARLGQPSHFFPESLPPAQTVAHTPISLTIEATCRISGLGRTSVWGLIKAGRLETARVGRRRLVLYRSLERLLLAPHQDGG